MALTLNLQTVLCLSLISKCVQQNLCGEQVPLLIYHHNQTSKICSGMQPSIHNDLFYGCTFFNLYMLFIYQRTLGESHDGTIYCYFCVVCNICCTQ